MTRQIKEQLVFAKIEKLIRASRQSFWIYCKTLYPDFYKESRPHLKDLCNLLQDFYEDKLLNDNGEAYNNLIINLPPQHGKSRTLVLFATWILGVKISEKIITCSYNDDLATDFSKYTRNIIQQTKDIPTDIIYSDIFPSSKIKRGDASYKKWALVGQHFSYLGAGVGAGITGRAGTLRIVDDLIKDKQTANSPDALKSIWAWFTDTFLSRRGEGGVKTVICMTRWADEDPCGKILSGPTKDDWYVLKIPVIDEEDNMLCEDILDYKGLMENKALMDPATFLANYMQETVNIKGKLYTSYKTYDKLPENRSKIISVVDTADTGKDKLAMITALIHEGRAYVLDIYYTGDPMEKTELEVARRLSIFNPQICYIESNNGGRGFARNVERLLWEKYQSRRSRIEWFHQSQNKIARILSNSTQVMNNIYFPSGWENDYRDAFIAYDTYQREGKNANDDLPDALTMLIEKIQTPQWVVIK
jgi:predicted phage terminase large subunit-like protein